MDPAALADEIEDLASLSSYSNYSDPEIRFLEPTAVNDIEFINSTNLGPDYTNNILVEDHNNGNLYFFKLSDRFGSITDIQTGPDGDVHIVSLESGSIYKKSLNFFKIKYLLYRLSLLSINEKRIHSCQN